MAKSKGTKRGQKKKRVAAHIKEAAEKRAAAASSGDGGDDKRSPMLVAPLGVGRPKRPREPAAAVSKAEDPARKARERLEATNYLMAWQSARKAKAEAEEAGVAWQAAGVWKFNKNTQAWLLRHVFSDDQLDDSAFEVLCLYLEGLKGAGRQRVLAEAQEVISKHGPDEGEEQTAAAREAAIPAAEVETVDETVADVTASAAPSGYNSDSSEEGGDNSSGGVVSKKIAEEKPAPGGVSTGSSGTGPGHQFAFSFVDPEAVDAESQESDSGSDSDEEEEGGTPAPTPVVKKPRKARSALTGQSKAEAKAKAATVSYERALRVAEVLS